MYPVFRHLQFEIRQEAREGDPITLGSNPGRQENVGMDAAIMAQFTPCTTTPPQVLARRPKGEMCLLASKDLSSVTKDIQWNVVSGR